MLHKTFLSYSNFISGHRREISLHILQLFPVVPMINIQQTAGWWISCCGSFHLSRSYQLMWSDGFQRLVGGPSWLLFVVIFFTIRTEKKSDDWLPLTNYVTIAEWTARTFLAIFERWKLVKNSRMIYLVFLFQNFNLLTVSVFSYTYITKDTFGCCNFKETNMATSDINSCCLLWVLKFMLPVKMKLKWVCPGLHSATSTHSKATGKTTVSWELTVAGPLRYWQALSCDSKWFQHLHGHPLVSECHPLSPST